MRQVQAALHIVIVVEDDWQCFALCASLRYPLFLSSREILRMVVNLFCQTDSL